MPAVRSLILILALLPIAAAAQAASPCLDGESPAEPYSRHDKWGMQRYDAELARYKQDHERYLRCLEREKATPDALDFKIDEPVPAAPRR